MLERSFAEYWINISAVVCRLSTVILKAFTFLLEVMFECFPNRRLLASRKFALGNFLRKGRISTLGHRNLPTGGKCATYCNRVRRLAAFTTYLILLASDSFSWTCQTCVHFMNTFAVKTTYFFTCTDICSMQYCTVYNRYTGMFLPKSHWFRLKFSATHQSKRLLAINKAF